LENLCYMSKPTERFSDRVDDYVRARPGYPEAVIAMLRKRIGLSPAWAVADVGAGTGISSKLFLDAGNAVTAVEPNAAMRDAAERALKHHVRFGACEGTAENTGLPEASVRLVVAAQAFHWFDRAAFRRECQRILDPGGHVVLIWNDRKTSGSSFLEKYERLLEEHATDYASVNHRNVGEEGVTQFFSPVRCQHEVFPNVQRFDFEGLKARLLSSSYAPQAGHPRCEPMLGALRNIFDATQDDGLVEMTYETHLYWGQVT
jgi:SAM-dependent methyltransferase